MADHVPFAADLDGVYDADRRERWELEVGTPQHAADVAMLQVAVEHDGDAGAGANPARDRLCALWIEEAPRFGAVAAYFPVSLRTKRSDPFPSRPTPWTGFVASFWAPEVLLFGNLYQMRYTRSRIDLRCASLIGVAESAGPLIWDAITKHSVDTGKPAFWSPELPEVRPFDGEGNARAAAGGWRDICVFVDPDGHRRIAHRLLAFLLLLCLAMPAGAQTLFGVVSRVSDGDTLTVGKASIRLYGIDAPESRQECQDGKGQAYRCGDSAEAYLLALATVGSSISCGIKDTDRYGRLIAVCSIASRAGSDLGRDLVLAGWAVAYRKYSDRYVAEEAKAKSGRHGIWAGSFQQPEEWRKGGGQ